MKILLVTYWTLPHVGGINSYVEVMKSGLEALGHQVDVFAHGPGKTFFHLTDGSRIIDKAPLSTLARRRVEAFCRMYAPRTTSLARLHEVERYSLELAAVALDLRRYDIIHTQDVIATYALSRVRPRRVPLVATIHGPLLRERLLKAPLGEKNRRYLALEERLGLLAADRAITPSHWLKATLAKDYALTPGAITVIHTGLNIDLFRQRAALGPRTVPDRGNRKVILCPARYTPVKGQRYLLSALSLLCRRRRDFVCWLAGDGPSRRVLEEQARRLRLGQHLAFLGARHDVPALLSVADIVVLPSLLEGGVPYAVQEAQVAGKPVVASRVSGLTEIVEDGLTGLLVKPRSAEALASALDRLLGDHVLRQEVGARARIWGQDRWNSMRMIAETTAVYHELHRGEGPSWPHA